jgi:uncharacterized protein YneF (UPF0154 family)
MIPLDAIDVIVLLVGVVAGYFIILKDLDI